MGARETHLAQAERNQKTIDYLLLKPTEFSEWITSIAFYKALHLIEATFEHHHCHDHGYRLNLLKLLAKTNKSYIIIFDRFRTLMTASCIARYLEQKETVGKKKAVKEYTSFSDFATPEKVQNELLGVCLAEIQQEVFILLKK